MVSEDERGRPGMGRLFDYCTFASSIASELVKGYSEIDAVANAKAFVFESIKQSCWCGDFSYKSKSD